MTPLVWANLPLGMLFVLAFAGIPLWMTFSRPQTPPDHSHARAYLRAKDRLLRGQVSQHSGLATARRHAHVEGTVVPGRQHWGGASPEAARGHRVGTGQLSNSRS